MKKILFALTAALAGAILLNSCNVENFLTIDSPSSISADAEGVSTTVSLKSGTQWNAVSDCDWVVLHNCSGDAGICEFALTVLPNTGASERSATVTITAGGNFQSISIAQKASTGSFIEIPEDYVPTVRISHNGASFGAPVIEYGSLIPMIVWGDGSAESYDSSLDHQYAEAGDHTVTIYSDRINAFTITDLSNLVSVETCNFK